VDCLQKSPAVSDEDSVVNFDSRDAWFEYEGTWAVFIGFLQKWGGTKSDAFLIVAKKIIADRQSVACSPN
jgi:hypothetical protein